MVLRLSVLIRSIADRGIFQKHSCAVLVFLTPLSSTRVPLLANPLTTIHASLATLAMIRRLLDAGTLIYRAPMYVAGLRRKI